ncbi:alpha/beta hydrolase family protein [Dictyobacter aurantiacus]|uniref:Putative esterase YitV n=1 Tax=Dictyobacter aurantiacus TaxID=1936993 RepID=A0A401ZS36_9CHLR|nr:alpha/beta fold hydrolase [Dictyobacter aurantiacus]GCE09590.1 putative esterase YitV [Dictyobacter aurantiacus]
MESIRLELTSAPILAIFQDDPEERAKRGTVLFYHGFGQSKDDYVPVLQRLAAAGVLAVGVDGIGHGERRYPDFHERFPPVTPHLMGNEQLEAAFLSTVQATTREVPAIIDALIACRWAHSGRIGIAGHSFGGFVTYAATIADKRIQAAVSVVGSPEWRLPWPDSPHLHLDRFFPIALLSQVAGKDTNVLPEFARALHQRLAPYYAQSPERLRYIEYPNSPHDLSTHDWEQAWDEAVAWFTTYLPRG